MAMAGVSAVSVRSRQPVYSVATAAGNWQLCWLEWTDDSRQKQCLWWLGCRRCQGGAGSLCAPSSSATGRLDDSGASAAGAQFR